MHEMRDVFPGGCETFVFVNSLNDVSDIFKESLDAEAFTEGVFQSIPVKGVYSDYYATLKEFYEKKMSVLTKDSIVIFIGDARNNNNPTGEEYVREISRKVRKTYWLNTESREKWNQNDSIIGVYKNYTDACAPVLTCGQLIDFLMNIR